MPRNVEIKARVSNLKEMTDKAQVLANDVGTFLQQEDTFFKVPNGRLKLRKFDNEPGVLIQYDRDDQLGPKLSNFNIARVEDVEAMKTVLSAALGVRGTVKKSRQLIIFEQTKIHLDQVEGLGEFIELEVILRDDQTEEEGHLIVRDIMKTLGISNDDLLDCAYMDMLSNA
ncbi:CYTH domain protein [Biomphalaria pfeifferi]|uniref:CYTH domain protein n=1 Tax=Biomphalaria pfeifferi TaxID=112525 RepID=A0AAD8B3X0_BIOPF|nr:CYTH domain protein [Biomphalaria pfeifferi]